MRTAPTRLEGTGRFANPQTGGVPASYRSRASGMRCPSNRSPLDRTEMIGKGVDQVPLHGSKYEATDSSEIQCATSTASGPPIASWRGGRPVEEAPRMPFVAMQQSSIAAE